MLSEYPLLATLAMLLGSCTAVWLFYLLMNHSDRAFRFQSFRVTVWFLAMALMVHSIYRFMRVYLHTDLVTVIPIWFLRDVAVYLFVIMTMKYMTFPRRRSSDSDENQGSSNQ